MSAMTRLPASVARNEERQTEERPVAFGRITEHRGEDRATGVA